MALSPSPGKEYFLVDSDQLRQLILDYSPDIRHDSQRMEAVIGELVDLEREKRGLGQKGGKCTLEINKHRPKNPKAPDYAGRLRLSGRTYEVRAYIDRNQQFINLVIE